MKFIAKPESVEAFKFTRASNIRAIEDLLGDGFTVRAETPKCIDGRSILIISNQRGVLVGFVDEGQWVVINEDSSFSFYSEKDFLDNYQMVEEHLYD